MKLLLALLVIAGTALALRSDIGDEQLENVQGIAAASEAVQATCLAAPCSGVRIASFGDSLVEGAACSGPAQNSYRQALKIWLCTYGGTMVNFVGSFTYPAEGAVIACPKTNGVGGRRLEPMWADLDALPTVMPTPTASDWIILGPIGTNDVFDGRDLSYMETKLRADVTKTAAFGNPFPGRIFLTSVPARNDGYNVATVNIAITNTIAWAQTQGITVEFLNVSSSVSIADLCGDGLHITSGGYTKMGQYMAREIIY